MTNPPTNLVGGEAGHVDHHNHLHLAHSQVPHPSGSTTDFLRGDGTWASPPGAGGSTGFSAAFGHRYVDYIAGNDTNDGNSPATAKKTLQAAHDALPSTGGIVWAAPGIHQITSQVNWTRSNSMLIGAGRSAGTEFQGKTNDIHMIRITGDYVSMSDFKIGDRSETTAINALSAIWLDGCEWPSLERIRFDNLGKTRGAGLPFATGPAGLRIVSTTKFGDWGRVSHCEFRSNYRGIVIGGGSNGWIQNCAFYGNIMEKVYIYKTNTPVGSGVSWKFLQCHWVGAPGSGFGVLLDRDPSVTDQVGNVMFLSCLSEFSAAGGGFGAYYVNLDNVIFDSCRLTMTAATGPTIRCGPDASNVIMGPYNSEGTTLFQVTSGNTGALKLWQSSNYSGSPQVI